MEKKNKLLIGLLGTKRTVPEEQEIEEFRKKSLFSIEKDNETGVVTIFPMNKEKNIVLHGEEWVRWFIELLKDTIQQ